ncbi:MAG: LemA family protein [Alphaproteobacteria bacterium]|nr:MAG: LemA family protein [Alphaproteobacteria bacterium]
MIATYITLGILVLLVFWLIATYNGLVAARAKKDEAWSDISVQMKRRYNLIPNLVETVKGYATHEKDTLERVIAARNAAAAATGSPADQAAAENVLMGAVRQLFAVAEAYPDLKANAGFLDLQNQLSVLEDHIQKARRFYNGNVRDLNMKVQSFPANMVAGTFGFHEAEFFELDEAEAAAVKQAPKVQF